MNSAAATLAAEVRFVESGRNVRLDTARHCFLVKSESSAATYEVTVAGQGAELRFTCTCPAGRHARHGKAVPCKHAAGVAHRGEREGWATFDGTRWVVAGVLAGVAA